jgi:hypothetical protein
VTVNSDYTFWDSHKYNNRIYFVEVKLDLAIVQLTLNLPYKFTRVTHEERIARINAMLDLLNIRYEQAEEQIKKKKTAKKKTVKK